MKSLEEAFGLESPRGAATPEDLKSYLIERANFHGVDPRLAASIFEQESSSGRNAGTSSAGARGPMQVMPATFRQMYPDGDINNPRHNVEAGIRYLKHGRDTLGTDDPRLLAAGYYQGYNRDSLKRGEIVDTNPDPRQPSVQRYADEVTGRVPQAPQAPRMKSLEEALGLEETSVIPMHKAGPQKTAPTPAKRNAFAYVNDFMIDAGNAVAGLAKAGVDFAAPGSAASQAIDEFIKQGQASQSDWKKASREKLNQDLKAAPDEWSKVSAYLSHAVIDDPLGLVAEAAGNIGPFAAFGKVLQAARLAEPMAEKIAMGLASMLSVGEVRGNIYDKIQATPDAELQRVNPDYARARQTMTEAQAKKEFGTQFVQHLPELALTAVVGALGGKYGLEALAVGVGPKVGRAGRAVIGTVDEGGQGAEEQLATNVGVARVDPRQTLGEDVPLNAAMEGLIGGVGGALSGSQGQQAPAPRPQPQPGQAAAPGAQPAGSVPPTAPSAAPAADAGHGGGIPSNAEDLLPGNAAAPAPQPQPQPNAWTEKGVEYRVVPVDEMLWHKYIRPDSQAKVDSFEEYRQRYPTITHMRLKSTDGGQTWKPSRAPFIGSEEKLLASRPPETPVMEAPEEVPKAEEVAPEVTAIAAEPAPNPEQRPASPEAESQAPVAASGESQGDAGVAPGQAAEAPDRFDPGNLTPGSPEYERAYENWAGARQSSKDAANSVRRREENKAAVEKRNGWRARFREWFLRAKDGDSITDTGTEASWKVIEKTRKDGTKTKLLVVVDENGNQILGASTGIGLVGDRVDGLEDGGIEEESGSAYLETQPQSLAAGLGKLMEEGEAVTRSVTETGPRDEDQPKSTVRDESQGQNPPSEDARSDLDAAAHAAATSPTNDLPEPTPPQKEAGNYQKGHIRIAGLDISIENPQGSKRSGVDRGGKPWSVTMKSHYGYIRSLRVKADGSENSRDWLSAYAKLFPDSLQTESLQSKGFDSLDIKAKAVVQGHVLAALQDRQILDAVVKRVPVDVMNVLVGTERTAEGLLRDPAMLLQRLAVPLNDPIRTAAVGRFIDAVASRHPTTLAGLGAEEQSALRMSDSPSINSEVIPASGTEDVSSHSGYFAPKSRDGDHIDVFVKPGTPEDYDGPVFVVDQKDPGTHEFDEHKVMLGFDSLEEAKAAYRSNYAQDWRGMQAIGTLPMAEFKAWLKEGDTTKPLAPVTGPKKEEPAKALPKEDMGAMFDDVLAEELAKDEAKKAPEPVKGGGWDRLEIVSTGFEDGSFIVREPNGRHDGSEQKYARFKLNDKGRPIAVEHFYEHSKAPVQAIIDKWAKDRKAPAAKPSRKDKAPPTPKWAADLKVKKGDQFLFKQEFDYVEAGEVVRVTEFSSDSVQIWNDKKNAGTFLKRWQMEKAIRDGIAVQVIAPKIATTERTASEAAASAVTNTTAALNAAIDGLGALFGGGGKLSSGLSFDEETYAKAKPLFQQAIAHFQAAGTDLKDAMRAIVRMVLDKFGADAMNAMKPYVVRFMEDVRDGKIRTQQEEGNGPEVDSGTEPGSAPIPPVGEDGSAADRGRGGEGEPGTTPGNGEVLGGTPTPDVSAPGAGPDRKPGSGAGAEDGRGRDGEPGSRDVPDGREGASGEGLAPDGTGSATDVTVPAPPKQPTLGNYHILDPESLIGGSPKVRFDRNKAAIETFRLLQDEGRDPTKEERDTLARYIGWGSFGQELFLGSWDRPRPKPGWEEADKWLRAHLGQKEWESAQRSIINAHYTDPPTVTTMWAMVRRMGFKGGRVLEPSVGIGNFLGLMPRDLEAASQLTGIELDALTGGMASMLYPDANIQIKGYQDSATADHFYDLVIGNWPFDSRGPSDRRYRLISPSLHDYFFLKAVDQVKPGGLVIGITSSGTMDKQGKLTRLDLARKADLIAAFRLPSGAFEKYAGTSVVTDIIVLRKRGEPNPQPDLSGWIETVEVSTPHGTPVRVNEYYKTNPDHVLGTLNWGHGTTQGRPGMIVDRPADLMQRLRGLAERVPEGIFDPRPGGKTLNYVRNSTADRENSVVEGDKGGLFVVRGEFMAPLHELVDYRVKDPKKTRAREDSLRALIKMRRAYGALVDAEREGAPEMEDRRKELNRQYQAFVKENGVLNRSDALTWMRKVGDPFWPSLAALERKAGDSYVPARILSEATVRTKRKLDKPSVRDAFVLGRNESMRIDMASIAQRAGVSEAVAAKELLDSGAVFKTPDGTYEARDVYLSGNVRRKMREALDAGASGQDMERNIAALKDVLPEDTPYYKIEAKLGAPWVSIPYYRQYAADLLKLTDEQRDKLGIAFRLGAWKIKLDDEIERKPEARSVWGTSRVNFGRILAAAFNNTKITVWDQHIDGTRSVNEDETRLVSERIGRLREEFSDWVWKDYARRMDLEREFNEVMNAEADPQFDGSFLSLEGMALHRGDTPFSLRQHQINAIWRGLVNRRGVYAHEVGTGKTYTMGGLAVESRRYGLARKPLLLAHNANAKSVAREIQEMYPAARLLYLGGLDKEGLPVAMRQIANDDWDAVIIPHSRIGMFGLRKETLMAMAAEEIAAMEQEAIEAAEEKNIELTVAMMDDFDNPKVSGRVRDATAKELVKARNAIIARIEEMAQKASKDGAIPFEELGIDMILVDEAHEFGKPPLATKMALRGLNKSTSNRSLSLRFLTSYVRSLNGGTGVHMFTGTPITNTLNEIYNLQRYVSQDIMERDGVSDWDSWFNTFADSTTDVELNAAGQYEPVTRLASFVNVAELRRMIGSYTDIVFADDMPEFAPRPTSTGKVMTDEGLTKDEIAELVNGRVEHPVGRPYKKIINDVGAMSPEQMTILKELQSLATMFKNAGGKARMEMMRAGHPASPVILETNASNAAMDARLYDMTAPDFEGSKVNRCVRNVARHYAEHPLATQVIFLERGFSDESIRTKKDSTGKVTKTKVKKFNLVNDIVEKLAAQGVKRSEIAVVAGGISDEKKKEIADAMNRAEIRVVIGQTATLGVGVNMQVNLRAMHHMDAPWRPGDLEQRNGRGHRQGNKWNTVLEYRYITDRLDGRRWQVLAVKERFIKAFLKADKNVRIIEGDAASMDEDDDILGSLSEAAGDPRILLLNKYKQDVERLENRQRTHMLGRQDAQYRLRSVLGEIEGLKKTLVLARKDAETVETLKDRDFAAEVNGKAFTDRKAFDEALKAHVETLGVEERDQKVASVYEIPLMVHRPWSNAPPEFTLKMALRQAVSPSSGSIEAVLRGAKNRAAKIEARIDELQRSIPSLEEAIVAPFPREADLTKKRDLYAQVEADLDINPVPPPAWLRQSAPVGTEIRVAGKAYPVSGHQYAKDGYYVIVETKDGARLVPYLFATDEAGQPLYEPRKFEAPPERGPRPLKVGEFVTLNADKTHWKVKKAPYEVKNGDQKRTVLKIQSVEDEDNERVVGETDVTRDETDVGAKRWEIRKLELTPAELRRAKLAAGIADEEPRTADFDYLERMATAFSRSDRRTAPFRPSRAMRVRDVEVAIAPIRAVGRGLPTVHVVQRVTDLPRELVKQIRADGSIVRGVFYHGQIYLIADNLGSPAETVFTMLHEAAHFGLKSVFGAEIDAVLMKIYRDNETVRRAADRRRARYPSLSQVKAVEEVLADWAGKNVEPSILQRLVAWVRDWFRRRGVQLQMTNADVLAIIARARGAWQRPSASRWTHVYSAPRQSQRMAKGEDTLFSSTPSSGEDFAASTLSLLSDIEDLYQQPKSDKKTLTEIAAEIDPGIKVLEMGSTAWNLDGMAIITMPDGVQAMIRTYKDGAVDIDASLFVEGVTRGTAAYNLAATYAHNNGWMFIGDPAGLTDAGLFRRTENMISSAMKFETTDHLYPHERQVAEGLQWDDGKDNLANLLKFSRELLAREMPEAADLVYDVDAKEFRNERTGENLDEAAFRDLARESRGARAARAGEATLKRAALLNTLVRATSPEARRSILGQVVRQLREGLDPALVGTFYSRKSPPGSRPASAVPSQAPQQAGLDVSGLRQRAQNFLDRAKMEVDPFAFVPDRKALETMRYQLLGRIARFDEIAADIKTIFSTASEEDQQAAYRYFLTPGADKAMIPNPSVAAMAERTKALIESVGDALVARGAMTPEVREAHRGRYLPQVYLKFLLGDQNWKALGAGKKISDRGYLKQRKLDRRVGDDGEVHVYDAQTGKVLDQEFLDAVLGPVEDPGYLSSLAIVRPMRDMAILDYLAAIAENAQWVLPKSVIEWRGKRVSAHWAKVEAERLRRQSRHQSEPDAGNAKKIAEELDVLADEALGEIEGEHADYRQIPNTARYGRLRGIWVRKEIYDDLMGVNDFLPADPGWAMSLLGYGGIGTRLTSLWKAGKVSLNPPAQVRNFVSNMVLLQLSGVPLRRIPTLFVRAFRQIMLYNEYRRGGRALSPEERSRVRHYLVALKYGVTESTFNAQELYRMQRDILEIERASGLLGTWGKIKLAVGAVMDYASDKYQLTEALGKTMKIMDEMERGQPEHEAALAAQEALFDYSLVSKNVRYLRNAPMGMPFLTFAVKVAPLLLKTARHHPERYLPWIALAYGLPALLAAAFDVDDDDIEALKKALPEWLQERGHAYVLPWKDDTGRWQVIDMGYFFPWTTWTEPIRMAAEGEAGKTVQALGLFSGPLTDLITAVMTGRDSFTGREIVAPGDPPKRQLLQIINYLWTMAMPPIITEHGAAGHAVRAATGQTDRFGDPLSTSGQAALRAVGVNVYPIHPETSRATNVRRMMREIADTEYALRKRLQDRGLSDEGKADLVKEYIAEVDRRRQKLMDYIEQSEVHPNLATETLQ